MLEQNRSCGISINLACITNKAYENIALAMLNIASAAFKADVGAGNRANINALLTSQANIACGNNLIHAQLRILSNQVNILRFRCVNSYFAIVSIIRLVELNADRC